MTTFSTQAIISVGREYHCTRDVAEIHNTAERILTWADDMAAQHGPRHEVDPMPSEAWGARDPIADLKRLMPDKPIIGVIMDRGREQHGGRKP